MEYTLAGSKYQPLGYSFETENYDFFHVIYIYEGELIYSDPSHEAALGPGSVAVLRMGSSFRLACPRKEYRGVFFNTLEEIYPEFRGSSYHCNGGRQVEELVGIMRYELSHQDNKTMDSLIHIGHLLAINALRQGVGNVKESGEHSRMWAARIQSTLISSIYSGIGVREVLSRLNLSYRQLCRHFRLIEKCSPKSFQIREKIREAEKLLSSTFISVTSIAHELGYPSSQYFSCQFKQVTGMTPSQYRNRVIRLSVSDC